MIFLRILLLATSLYADNVPFYPRDGKNNTDYGGLNQDFQELSSRSQDKLTNSLTPISCPSGSTLTGAFFNKTGGTFGGTCLQVGVAGSTTAFWAASGNNIYNTNTGFVGINTSSPQTQLDVLGPIRSKSLAFVNPTGGTGTELYYDATVGQGVFTPFDRTNSLFKQMLIGGDPIIISSSGTANNYVINPTSTTFSADYAVLAPI